jgi:hypothetical protein
LAERQLRATEVRQRPEIEAAADKSRAETEAILKERCAAVPAFTCPAETPAERATRRSSLVRQITT